MLKFPYNDGRSLLLIPTTVHFGINNKFISLTSQDAQSLVDINDLQALMDMVSETNQNSMLAQKKLLLWHQHLGHADFQNIQRVCQPS
jgi:hypothetical protein